MPKRKSAAADEAIPNAPLRRSLRNAQTPTTTTPASSGSKTKTAKTAEPKQVEKPTSSRKRTKVAPDVPEEPAELDSASDSAPEPPAKKGRSGKQQQTVTKSKGKGSAPKKPAVKAKANGASVSVQAGSDEAAGERTYWLMKAEPETRLENGVDVRFSIDDLAAKAEPEPWDGIRAYAARNNLRAMKKGDLAFFYHSNCKEPGIVGTMEIVQEHSPDLSAHDPKAPYYDASSKPSDPKWSVVHVEFRSKFAVPITLKELREMGGSGKPLENMQMLKQSRLSVSKVSASEWEYLTGVAKDKAAA